MHLKFRNVNDAFRGLVRLFHHGHADRSGEPVAVERYSRNGPVLVIDQPVTITYSHPRERVLFNAARDANPFFHLYEALWMLAGRNDVAPLSYYCSRMKDFSDDGVTLNGAYGYRWRHWESYSPKTMVGGVITGDDWPEDKWTQESLNQLDILVSHLKAFPESRRAVLTMWQVGNDMLKVGRSKDVCCNLSAMFALREEYESVGHYASDYPPSRLLDMTVINRSNDLLWGLLGANYVHFTILQEYMAARLGAEVGVYNHFTNNLHVYKDRPDWRPEEFLADPQPDYYIDPNLSAGDLSLDSQASLWGKDMARRFPLVKDPVAFEEQLPIFVAYHKDGVPGNDLSRQCLEISEPFLKDVADPMLKAFHWYKRIKAGTHRDEGDIQDALSQVAAGDWYIAAKSWLERRSKKGAVK